ncbi:MAG: hypothetical protein ACTSRC_19475 [Candidatus Helarchaeota archaeon]
MTRQLLELDEKKLDIIESNSFIIFQEIIEKILRLSEKERIFNLIIDKSLASESVEESILIDLLDNDTIIRMPPKKRYKKTVKIVKTRKAKPRIFVDDLI